MNKKLKVKLSWKILEHKWRYYVGRSYGINCISDEKYDKLELKYNKACDILKENKTASEMVGFDFNRPSCALVHSKMCRKYKLEI